MEEGGDGKVGGVNRPLDELAIKQSRLPKGKEVGYGHKALESRLLHK
jgi:hypothetical protein